MPDHRTSYWKTAIAAATAGVLVLAATIALAPADGLVHSVTIAAGMLAALPPLLVASSGFMVLHRDVTVARGRPDLFHAWNRSRSEQALAAGTLDLGLRLRRIARGMVARNRLVVGDEVEIRSVEEIRRTLDGDDCLDGLPFMPEMVAFCGQRAQVFRRVDKIYDYGGKKVLRRLEGTVLLHLLRCDGSGHGGCQAGCYLMWKEAWLTRVPAAHPLTPTLSPWKGERGSERELPLPGEARRSERELPLPRDGGEGWGEGATTYRCQFTQLASASTPMHHWDPRLDLRPLLAGNVTVLTFTVALMTRFFNYVQTRRGGMTFPAMQGPITASPVPTGSLMPGELVRVHSVANIAQTLDKGFKNRGLWFDRDMVKHCDRPYVVLKRVDRIIDDATGRMRTMKTPCIVLRDVTYSGEYLRFLAQEEHLYWREAWLRPSEQEPRAGDPWLQPAGPAQAAIYRPAATGN